MRGTGAEVGQQAEDGRKTKLSIHFGEKLFTIAMPSPEYMAYKKTIHTCTRSWAYSFTQSGPNTFTLFVFARSSLPPAEPNADASC